MRIGRAPFRMLSACALLGFGCSASGAGEPSARPASGGVGGAHDAGPDQDASTSGSSGDGGVVLDAGPSDAGLTADSACVTGSVVAERLPVDLYLMIDSSGSMTSGGAWDDLVLAVRSFFEDPSSAGLRVALGYFPEPGGSCDATIYATPSVDFGELGADVAPADAQEAAL